MVAFWFGTKVQYDAEIKNNDMLYFVTDKGGIYKGDKIVAELSADAVTELKALIGDMDTVVGYDDVASALTALFDAITEINGDTGATSVNKKIAAVVGEDTDTAEDFSLYGAFAAIQDALTDSTVVINQLENGNYEVKQGDTTIGLITIPKDMVVSSGSIVTDPEGQDPGTYIELVIANSNNDKLYINTALLVDEYEAEQNAVQVQLSINQLTRTISAIIVPGSIGTTELADKGVTFAKLDEELQYALTWHTAED